MTYHVIPRRPAFTPGIGAFQKESGELEDLPKSTAEPDIGDCPPGNMAVRDYVRVRGPSGNQAYRSTDPEACVVSCPSGYVEHVANDIDGKHLFTDCIPASTYNDMRVWGESVMSGGKPHESSFATWTPAKKAAAATVAGGSALALLAFLL